MRPPDILTLVLGLTFCLVAGIASWIAMGAPSAKALQIVIPLGFVIIGVLGLAFARKRQP
ncbi:MAG: hypothetical protein WAV45_03535 [Propionibacteriaceae bacterium]|nr:hypothetical protein [Micropruina sp.]